MSSPPLPPPGPLPPGSKAAEITIFSAICFLFFAYHFFYFQRHRSIIQKVFGCCGLSQNNMGHTIDLWTTAVETRTLWARLVMKDKGEALLAVHTMRNVVIAATLIVAATGQMVSRLFETLANKSALDQINTYTNSDPIGSTSFSSPELKVALSAAFMLLSFGAFAMCARLAVHMSFMLRVKQSAKGSEEGDDEVSLKEELFNMTHRISIYFSVGIRLLFFSFILLSWCLGVTVMLIWATVVMALLFLSDYMPKPLKAVGKKKNLPASAAGDLENNNGSIHHGERPDVSAEVWGEHYI